MSLKNVIKKAGSQSFFDRLAKHESREMSDAIGMDAIDRSINRAAKKGKLGRKSNLPVQRTALEKAKDSIKDKSSTNKVKRHLIRNRGKYAAGATLVASDALSDDERREPQYID